MNRRTLLLAPVALAVAGCERRRPNRYVVRMVGLDRDGNSLGIYNIDVRKIEEYYAKFPEFTFFVHTRLLT